MALLDSPAQRVKLVTAVETFGGVKAAAQHLGISRQSIGAYLRAHPDLKLEVDAARRRYETIAFHAPRMLPANRSSSPAATSSPTTTELAPVRQVDRDALLDVLEMHARDSESRGCAKALHILSELAFAPELLRMRAEAKRAEAEAEQGDRRPMVVRVPIAAPLDVDVVSEESA